MFLFSSFRKKNHFIRRTRTRNKIYSTVIRVRITHTDGLLVDFGIGKRIVIFLPLGETRRRGALHYFET